MKEKTKVKQTPEERKENFVKWYIDDRKPFLRDLGGSIRPIVLIPVCIIIALYVSTCLIGDGLYKYDERTYKAMERAIEYAIVPDGGIDTLGLQTKDLYLDELYTSGGSDSEDFIYFNSGETPNKPRKMTTVDTSYDSKDGYTILTCTVKDGLFFNAKITTKLDAQHQFVEWSRNFKSFNHYLLFFWVIFGVCTIGGGVLLYLGIEGVKNLYWWAKFKRLTKRSKKDSKEEAPLVTEVSAGAKERVTVPGIPAISQDEKVSVA